MDGDTREDVLKRCAYIGGHLHGVRGMIEDDARCVDVVRQTYAVRQAIKKVEAEILDGHVRHCMCSVITSRRPDDPALRELIHLLELVASR